MSNQEGAFDRPEATVDRELHVCAYQAALATIARVLPASLTDFLR